jgi:hypothetical protein
MFINLPGGIVTETFRQDLEKENSELRSSARLSELASEQQVPKMAGGMCQTGMPCLSKTWGSPLK